MHFVEKELKEFAAAHRLGKGYQGKCQHLHGHNYRVVVLLTGVDLNCYDFLIDFNDIKLLFDQWVQDHWDHCTLIAEPDTTLLAFIQEQENKYFLIPGGHNTTAEVLARFLFETFTDLLKQSYVGSVSLVEVKVYENVRSAAACRADNALVS
jgi:6-pyruvoyltetrahydropterin/6-carboxytetrahydropterin synthase